MRHGGKRGFLGKQQRPTPSLLFLLRGKDRGRDRRYLFLGRSQRDVRRRVQVVSERPDLLSVPAVHSLRHWSSAASYRRSSHKNVFWFTSQCLIWCSLVCKNTAAKTESALTQTHEWRAEHMKLHQVTGFYCRNIQKKPQQTFMEELDLLPSSTSNYVRKQQPPSGFEIRT